MKRLVLSISLLTLLASGMDSAPLTPRQAVERLNTGIQYKAGLSRLADNPVYTQLSDQGTPTAYVFNNADGQGFRILSADDAAYPVLGYSDNGYIDPDNLEPEFKNWLQSMGAQIAQAARKGSRTGRTETPSYGNFERISPMIQTHWNQGAPFNDKVIERENSDGQMQRCTAGSAAVAMAQLMKYFRYPQTGQGQVSYELTYWDLDEGVYKKIPVEADLSSMTFDWDNMLDNYGAGTYTQQQADAVATLMKAAGYSIGTNYWVSPTNGSYGSNEAISRALRNHFGYDCNTRLAWRSEYSTREWIKKIYDNLKNVGPLIIIGKPSYGHNPWTLICDGYDGDGYFHFNWGWDDRYDGYYLLEALSLGTDGHLIDAADGFTYEMGAVFGAQPPTGAEPIKDYDNLLTDRTASLKIADGKLIFNFGCVRNPMDHPVSLGGAVILEPQEETPGETKVLQGIIQGEYRLELPLTGRTTLDIYDWGKVSVSDLADGRYKATYAVRDLNTTDSPYVPLRCGYRKYNYGYINVKDGKPSVENVTAPDEYDGHRLKVEKLEVLSPLHNSRYAKFRLTLRNENDIEVSQTLHLNCAYNDLSHPELDYEYNSSDMSFTVPANSEKEYEVSAKITYVPDKDEFGDRPKPEGFFLYVADAWGEILRTAGFVKMNYDSTIADLTPAGLTINDCPAVEETIDGKTVRVYQVPTGKFNATTNYRLGPGYFDGVISFNVYRHNSTVWEQLDPVAPGLFRQQQFSDGNVDGSVTADIDFKDSASGQLYVLGVNYANPTADYYSSTGNAYRELDRVHFRLLSSGIWNISEDAVDAPSIYYNLQGVRVLNPEKGQMVIKLQGNRSEKVIF